MLGQRLPSMLSTKGRQGECISSIATLMRASRRRRSYVNAWSAAMRTHEAMAESRIKFALRLSEMSDELNNLCKEVDKSRKAVRSPRGLVPHLPILI